MLVSSYNLTQKFDSSSQEFPSQGRRICSGMPTLLSFTVRMPFLETNRLLFRTHESQDQDDFVRMHTDPAVRRYMGGEAWPLEKALDRFRTQYLGKPAKTYGLWATILKEEGKYVGCCGLRAAENEGTAFLAYILAQPYWGRGLATEASQAFIHLAFTSLHLPRLLADVEKGNAASEHILQKFGFKFLRQDEIAATRRIILILELSKSSWKANST